MMIFRQLRGRVSSVAHSPKFYWLTAPVYHRLAAPVYRAGLASTRYMKWKLTESLNERLRPTDEGKLSALFRRWIWMMNRSYRPSRELKANLGADFDLILSRIATNEEVSPGELLPYLCLESLDERCQVNALLADAYLQRGTEKDLRQARIFIERAWLLSRFSKDLLPLYVKICTDLKDARGVREAYKRLGMAAAAKKNIPEAIHYFTYSHYADLAVNHLDRYEFDLDILSAMDELAAPYRFEPRRESAPAEGGKIRVAYLVKGMTELNSILVKINLVMAQHHDKSLFDIMFFMPEPEQLIAISAQAREHVRAFESFGCRVVTAPNLGDQKEQLLAIARRIYDARPHILVTSAALANFDQYFITSLRPAPITIGLIQGPPPQFAPPILDWGIAWTRHPLMDSPVNCSLVVLRLDYAEQALEPAYERKEFGLPEGAPVLLSAGRFPKFQDRDFWKAIAELLSEHEDAHYIVAGPRQDQIPFLDSVLPEALRTRVKFLGWREDILRILPVADVVIDTYPSGGGQVLVQAMRHAIPFVAHANDYMQLFDQTSWNPIEEFISDPEMIVPRGDFERLKEAVSKFILDQEHRQRVGEDARAEYLRHADSELAVRKCEEIYRAVLERFSPLARSA